MAIGRPEAIDAALDRAAAERRTAAGGYFASRCKERLRSAENSRPPPLRLRRSRQSRPSARSGHERHAGASRTGRGRTGDRGRPPARASTRTAGKVQLPRKLGGRKVERAEARHSAPPRGQSRWARGEGRLGGDSQESTAAKGHARFRATLVEGDATGASRSYHRDGGDPYPARVRHRARGGFARSLCVRDRAR